MSWLFRNLGRFYIALMCIDFFINFFSVYRLDLEILVSGFKVFIIVR